MRLWPRPSRERFASQVVACFRAAGVDGPVRFESDRFRVVVGEGKQAVIHLLDNHYAEFTAAWPWQRTAITQRYVTSLLEANQEHRAQGGSLDTSRIVAVVRSPVLVDQVRLEQPDDRIATVTFPVGGFLLGLLVQDSERSMTYVNGGELVRSGLSVDDAIAIGLRRLAESTVRWCELPGGVLLAETNDDYDAARVLVLPRLLRDRGYRGRPIAICPHRGCLLVGDADDSASLAHLAAYARDAAKQPSGRFISVVPIVPQGDDPSSWRPYEAPWDAAHSEIRELTQEGRVHAYNEQQALLNQLNERKGHDIFVATARAMRRKSDGVQRTFATWSRGVPTLLPECDIVVLFDGGLPDDKRVLGFFTWESIMRVHGDLLVLESDLLPPRWSTRGFPSNVQGLVEDAET